MNDYLCFNNYNIKLFYFNNIIFTFNKNIFYEFCIFLKIYIIFIILFRIIILTINNILFL